METADTTAKPQSNTFQCQLCPYNTLRRPYLDKHLEQKHGFSKVVPKEEKVAKKRGRKKKMEESEDTSELEFMCKMCKYKSSSIKNLKLHMSTHNDVYYKCTVCDFQTVDVKDLKEHENSHKSLQIYHCDNCDYSSTIKSNLKMHMKTHQVPVGEPCGFCDNYTAHHKSYLYKHIKLHHNDSRTIHECDQCDYATPSTSHLKQHKLVHFPKVPRFQCDICEFQTNTACTIRKHRDRCDVAGEEMIIREIDGETNQVWFCCDRCEFKAKDQRYVTLHKKNHVKADEINRIGREIFFKNQKRIVKEEIEIKDEVLS